MRFRLLVERDDGAADGASNMAVDEALLESAMLSDAIPTLRLYRFRRPTVTFGYAQDVVDAVNEAACRDHDIDWVRRITGGRALLHQHELTYSVTAPPFVGSVRATYRAVTGAIRSALERLRVPLDPPRQPETIRAPRHLPCLAVPTGHEITATGNKLVASAMRFRRRGFLQHGSILWAVDHALWKKVTRLGEHDAMPAVGLSDLDGPAFGEDDLVESLSSAFEELLGEAPTPGSLSAVEVARASELAEKYRSSGWTIHRLEAPIPIG